MGKILITGGTGFIGGHLARALETDTKLTPLLTSRTNGNSGANIIGVDLTSFDELTSYKAQLEQVEILVHMAANVSHCVGSLEENIHNLTDGVDIIKNLVSILPNLKKVVHVSSCYIKFRETDKSLYALRKYIEEELLKTLSKSYDFDVVSLRFPQVYGLYEPHGSFIAKFIDKIFSGEEAIIEGNGAVYRDLLYVKDAVGSIMTAMDYVGSGVFTVSPNEPVTIIKVIETLESVIGKSMKLKNKEISISEAKRKSSHFDNNLSKLGYNLRYNLDDGIRDMLGNEN